MNADVSVVIPHFNATDTMRSAIQSVVDQTAAVKELIIVDDCSEDYAALLKITQEFSGGCVISVIRLNVNSGAAYARSEGVRLATAKYIAFLDSDDIWHPEKIELQYSFMERHEFQLSGHDYVHDVNKQSMSGVMVRQPKVIKPLNFMRGNPFFTPTVMARREGFINFDARYRRLDDYKCWLLNVQEGAAVRLPAVLAGGFKPAIGFSGLTSSFSVMHAAFVEVLNDLYREGVISLPFFLGARIIEAVKFPLRVIKSRIC